MRRYLLQIYICSYVPWKLHGRVGIVGESRLKVGKMQHLSKEKELENVGARNAHAQFNS